MEHDECYALIMKLKQEQGNVRSSRGEVQKVMEEIRVDVRKVRKETEELLRQQTKSLARVGRKL